MNAIKEQINPTIAHIINIIPESFGILLIMHVKTNAMIAIMKDTMLNPIKLLSKLAPKLTSKLPINTTHTSLSKLNIIAKNKKL